MSENPREKSPYIHITHHKKGLKMTGFISINTSQKLNPFCQKQCTNERSVCKYCYGETMEKGYPNLRSHLINNYYRLSTPLSDQEITDLANQIIGENRHYVRYHSIGELTGINHLLNYYRVCEEINGIQFGIWTKRAGVILKTKKAPDNLSLIYSNPVIDQPMDASPARFNGVFNVVSYEYCIEHGIVPNCTGLCIKCLKCYTGDPVVVTELLKKDQTSILKGFLEPLEEIL